MTTNNKQELLDLEDSITDSPYYRSKVRAYEDYAAKLELSIQGLTKASKALQGASTECGAKSMDVIRRVSALTQLSPISDPDTERILAGYGDVVAEIERNKSLQCEQVQHILVQPMEEMADTGLLSKIKTTKRRLDALQNEYESQLTRLMSKKPTEPFLEHQETEVEAAKAQYTNQMQLYSLDLNRLAAVKSVEFLEGFLSLMYAQYAFYHQAFSSMRDFEPTMRKLGEQIARARREAEQGISDAATHIVESKGVGNSRARSAGSIHDDTDGYVQVGQQEDDAPFGLLRRVETFDDHVDEQLTTSSSRPGAASAATTVARKSDTRSNTFERSSTDVSGSKELHLSAKHASTSSKSPRSHRRSLASISLSPSGLFQISGYLFLRSQYSLMASWQRRWFEIKDGLLVHFQRDEEKDKESVPLHLCMVKRGTLQDRRNVFELIAPNRTYILQAESSHELNAWKACLKQAIETSLYSHTPPGNGSSSSAAKMRSISRKSDQLSRSNSQVLSPPMPSVGGLELQRVSSQLSAVQLSNNTELDHGAQATRMAKMRYPAGNDRCVDCSNKDPEWAAINLGVLMCIECSGIHRSLGVHVSKVRSVKLDNWDAEFMQIMQRLGNKRVNRIYEAVDPLEDEPKKPTAQSSRERKQPYLLQKYANRLFVEKAQLEEANAKLIRAAGCADLPLALEALAQGANPDAHDPTTGRTPLIEAVGMGDFGMLELLFLWGADPNTRGKITATSYMNESPKTDQTAEPGADDAGSDTSKGSAACASGGTALHLATRLGNVRVVWYLIRKNAQWDTPDAYGLLPLDIALEDSNVQVVMALRYAAFQKASGLPPGTLGSRRQRANGPGAGSASEPVDMLDMDDSFIRDWAIPPYSPYVDGSQSDVDSETASSKDVEFVDSASTHAADDDAEFGELQAA
ncbi:hypothetical protein GGI25_004906 [Coemansia spiralis]|uniref:ArfGap-domain-containing protein n=2 Tax=Coemansia TaxID=4863 RepID=A0A9W8G3Y0_9FUNG|nr:hypothetical protein BX070DRAFT_217864 [Coemansia spiralis]KAJ1990818.1 hypothetical protein EDC05_003798 [Coemansia umbellata]KAJ2622604.1 hypothetical protein GGI26_003050 [Coemansia sp. RSA 1358]KAJ2672925.1 hypothetical protein GGI25_004906 [Coemansia spiralis]